MDYRCPGPVGEIGETSAPHASTEFAAALLGQTAAPNVGLELATRRPTARSAWLSEVSLRHQGRLLLIAEDETQEPESAHRDWLAEISTEHERQSGRSLSDEAQQLARSRFGWLAEDLGVQEADWDPAKHPRRGGPPNTGWFARKGGGGRSGSSRKRLSPGAALRRRNREIVELTGVVTPSMIRARRLAADLSSAARLPGAVARATAAGLGTGSKAAVNGFATSVKNVATLGLSSGQLELIGVTQADRDRGYDTAVSISTGSGQVLIAVGTGGVGSALAKGGSVARTAGGALLVYDTAGNAVGAVQGIYDAKKDRREHRQRSPDSRRTVGAGRECKGCQRAEVIAWKGVSATCTRIARVQAGWKNQGCCPYTVGRCLAIEWSSRAGGITTEASTWFQRDNVDTRGRSRRGVDAPRRDSRSDHIH